MTPEAAVIESLFYIPDKYTREDVPFRLNSAQQAIDNNFHPRLIIPKARQEGVSFYFVARKLVRCLHRKNTRAVIIGNDAEATQKHLERVNYLLDHMAGGIRAITATHNKNEITFPKTNSTIYIGTAGSRSFGRGDTLTDVLCTEVAYWDDAKSVMTGLLNAVPEGSGEVAIESTGNGMGNWFHNRCMRAMKGEAPERLVFLPWWNFSEYTWNDIPEDIAIDTMANLKDEWGEPGLVKAYGLDAGRILWRRQQISKHDFDIPYVNQEYPASIVECFKATGYSLFTRINYIDSPDWVKESPQLHTLKGHPREGGRYAIGADVAAGVGKDSSVAEVFDVDRDEQVGEWASNRCEPDIFAIHIAELGRRFNNAYVGVESNNHGILTVSELKHLYPNELLYYADGKTGATKSDAVMRLAGMGVKTSRRSKPYIIGALRKALASGTKIYSPLLVSELASFVEHEDGTMGAQEGAHDDCVVAAALAKYVEPRAMLMLEQKKAEPIPVDKNDPFLLDNIIKELTGGRNNFPIRDQAGPDGFFG